jgi:Trypsin
MARSILKFVLDSVSETKFVTFVATIGWGFAANAEVIRNDYNMAANPNYSRYFTLANLPAFATVGSLTIDGVANDCTGTLISANTVLTAAHCFAGLTNPSTSFFGGPSAASATYGGNADQILPDPAYNPNTQAADLALVRIPTLTATAIGSVPTSFIPLYTGTGELSIPSPNIAVTIGYGLRGDGVVGATKGSDGTKVGGLTVLNSTAPNSQTLSATFLSPKAFAANSLPSNFLEASTTHGDSGGPLLSNFLPGISGYAIIGVASYLSGFNLDGNGYRDLYGDSANWTRVSAYSAWITSATATLDGLPPATVAGTTLSSPLLPNPVVSSLGSQSFSIFASAETPYYFDPTASTLEEVTVTLGPDIGSIFIPATDGTNVHFLLYNAVSHTFVDSGTIIPTGRGSISALRSQNSSSPE